MVVARVFRCRRFPGRSFRSGSALLAAAGVAWLGTARGLAAPIKETPPQDAPLVAPATAPATGPSVQIRGFDDVRVDLDAQGRELAKVLPGLDSLFDESKRAEAAPKALPVLKKMSALMEEAQSMAPQSGQLRRAHMELAAMMSLLGDEGGTLQLRKQTVATDEDEAASATAWEYVVAFAHAGKNADAQKKAVADLARLARGNPTNDMIGQGAYLMSQQAANPEISAEAEKIITEVLRGPMSERMAADLANAHKLHALENKPMLIEGRKVDGSAFSSADWKGKVILVDFWATWCAPCMREFPHLKKVYDACHDKGLEMVGVSCDTDASDLKNFLRVNPGLSWPQLFDPKAADQSAFHPLAVGFGVKSIPTLFLIDRKGVLRTVDAGQNLDARIQKLLDEKAE